MLVPADEKPEGFELGLAKGGKESLATTGNVVSANQLMGIAKRAGLFGLAHDAVQTFNFLFHGHWAHEPVFEQDEQVPVRRGFHFNRRLVAHHSFVAWATAIAAFAGARVVVPVTSGGHHYSQ